MNSVLTIVACASVGLYCGVPAQPTGKTVVVQNVPKAHKPMAGHAYQARTIRLLRTIPDVSHTSVHGTGKLAGSSVSDLYAAYVGVTGKVPKSVRINWNLQLKSLWAHKFRITSKTAVRDTGNMLVEEYNHLDPERMTLEQYQAIADTQSRIVYRSLNWAQVGKAYFYNGKTKSVDAQKLALLKRVTANIHGRTLVAYAMTELLPTSGSYGREYMDFLLRGGGRRYVESLPALHDKLTSFGPFQFTAQAVFDTGSGAVGGASLMNRALPVGLRTPVSVTLFRGNDHLRAAELFAIANVAMFIRRLNPKHVGVFERIADSRTIELAQFIATAHNKPVVAYAAGVRWLDAKAGTTYQHGCPEVSRLYASKTEQNYRSLRT